MPEIATMTPLPVATEFAISGEAGSPVDAWMSATASGSCASPGWMTEDGGHCAPVAAGAAALVCAAAAAGEPVFIDTGLSGTTFATDGRPRSRPTSADGTVAATALTLISCVILLPPCALIAAMIGAWSACDAATRCLL